MDNFMTVNFGSIAIVFICAVIFIGALVSVTYKDKIEKIKRDAENMNSFSSDNDDMFVDYWRKENRELDINPVNDWLPGNVFYKLP